MAALLHSWFFCRWFLYIVFVFLLGAICSREALRYDFLIAEKVGESGTAQQAWAEGPGLVLSRNSCLPLTAPAGNPCSLGPRTEVEGVKPWERNNGPSYGSPDPGDNT